MMVMLFTNYKVEAQSSKKANNRLDLLKKAVKEEDRRIDKWPKINKIL